MAGQSGPAALPDRLPAVGRDRGRRQGALPPVHPSSSVVNWRRAWRAFLALHSESSANPLSWTEGLRAAVGIATPVAVGLIADHLAWGVLCGFAVLWIMSCDLGGAYRQKALTLTGSGATLIVAYLFGIVMTWSVPNYIVGIFVWVFSAALIGVAGSAAAQAGLVSSTIVITSVALIAPGEYWSRLAVCIAGIGWALLLCLALWPLRAYSPVFQALSVSCRKLADLSDALWAGTPTAKRVATNVQFAIAYDGLMTSLERCRAVWGAIRVRRAGPTARSMQLLLLIEQVDDLARILVTFREIINLVGKEPWFDRFRSDLQELTTILGALGRESAEGVSLHGKQVDPTHARIFWGKIEHGLDLESAERLPAWFQRKELARTARHLVEQFTVLAEIVSELKTGQPSHPEPPEAKFGPRPRTFNPIGEIRNSLSFRSSSFRHALRLGTATALAAAMASAFQWARAYWIPMTVVLVLKPNFGGTLQRAVQRVSGTVLGALLAAVLLVLFQDPSLLVVGLAGLAFATFTLRNFNYSLFALALTPTVMVMLDVTHPGTLTDSFLRILYTVIGSVLALLCGYLLFPLWESRRFPVDVAKALRAEAGFLRAFRDLLEGKVRRPMSEFRRGAAIAVSNAATAAERILSEPVRRRGNVEASLTAVNCCRQILHALAAISDYPAREPILLHEPRGLAGLLEALAQALDELATGLERGGDSRSLPDVSALQKRVEEAAPGFAEPQEPPGENPPPGNRETSDTGAWLLYHLTNVMNLTVAMREVASRLLQAESAPRP